MLASGGPPRAAFDVFFFNGFINNFPQYFSMGICFFALLYDGSDVFRSFNFYEISTKKTERHFLNSNRRDLSASTTTAPSAHCHAKGPRIRVFK